MKFASGSALFRANDFELTSLPHGWLQRTPPLRPRPHDQFALEIAVPSFALGIEPRGCPGEQHDGTDRAAVPGYAAGEQPAYRLRPELIGQDHIGNAGIAAGASGDRTREDAGQHDLPIHLRRIARYLWRYLLGRSPHPGPLNSQQIFRGLMRLDTRDLPCRKPCPDAARLQAPAAPDSFTATAKTSAVG